jgi:hypothetical protein
MKVNWKCILPAMAILAVTLMTLVSCMGPLVGEQGKSGLVISIVNSNARTLAPTDSMVVTDYTITCTKDLKTAMVDIPASASTSRTIFLEPGNWTVEVDAYNAGGALIGGGTVADVEVIAGEVTSLSVSVAPLPGDGTLNLTIDYSAIKPIFEYFSGVPSIMGEFTPAGRAPFSIVLPLGESSVSSGNLTVPAGYYSLKLALYDGENLDPRARAAPESLRIVQGLKTTGTVLFTNPGSGIQMTIETDMLDPIAFTFEGFATWLPPGDSMTVTATPSINATDMDPIEWEWYLDGIHGESPASTYNYVEVPSGLNAGTHRLDVFASTSTRAGSSSLFFVVASSEPGSFEVTDQASLEALRDMEEINGDLILSDPNNEIDDLSPLSSLRRIGGNLVIQGMLSLSDLSDLSSLESVGGWIEIHSTGALIAANIPSLTFVGEGILVYENPALGELVFGGLSGPDLPEVEIYSNDSLAIVDLHAADASSPIKRFASSISIYDNRPSTGMTLDFSSVVSAAGSIYIDGNNIATLDLSALARTENANASADGSITIANNSALRTLDLGSYISMGECREGYQVIGINGNYDLETVDLSGLGSFAHRLEFAGNEKLVSIDLGNLVSMTDFWETEGDNLDLVIEGNPALQTVHLEKLRVLASNCNGTDLIIQDNPSLVELPYMPLLARVEGSVVIARNGITHLYDADSTPSGFRVLASVSGDFIVEGNPNLLSAALGLLAPLILPGTEGNTIRISDNEALADLEGFFGPTGIDRIEDQSQGLEIFGNLVLSSIDSLGGSQINGFGNIYIQANPALHDLAGFEKIRSVSSDVCIEDNATLAGVSLPVLEWVGSGISVSGNPALAALFLPRLESVDQDLEITENPNLDKIDLSALDYVGWDFMLNDSQLLNLDMIDIDADLDSQAFRFQYNRFITNSDAEWWCANPTRNIEYTDIYGNAGSEMM